MLTLAEGKIKWQYGIGLLFLLYCLTACSSKSAEKSPKEIKIFAAASLGELLSDLAIQFEQKTSYKLILSFASSGTLARQIEQGAGADIYLSANQKWVDYLDKAGYVLDGNQRGVAKNRLVLIAPGFSSHSAISIDSTLNLSSLLGGERLSMGDPAHVPAGIYAKEALSYFGWYEALEKQILPAKDVRAALMVNELGEAPFGIVYRTDAKSSEKVKILATFPEKSHNPIEYVAALCSDGEGAKAFFSFLASEESKQIWREYGFEE